MSGASAFNLLLVAALLCAFLLLFLGSLSRSGIPGISAWGAGNAIGFCAYLLYAFDASLPPVLGYEGANGAYALANVAIYIGFCRFFKRTIPWTALGAGLAVFMLIVSVFHYVHYSFAFRTIAVSLFNGAVCVATAYTIIASRRQWGSFYPYALTATLAFMVAAGHLARAVAHGVLSDDMTSLLQPAPWNLFFITLGTLVLPILAMGAITMVHDRMMRQAEHAANHDYLTDALSRRAFFQAAERELQIAARTGRALTLMMFDVDHFKRINDQHGHAVGDQVLMEIASQVKTVMRGSDYFARLGGEEFCVLLPETDTVRAGLVAERLRQALDQQMAIGLPNPAKTLPIAAYTVSIGIAVLGEGEALPSLMLRADRAMYAAKSRGRNTVVLDHYPSIAQRAEAG